MIGHYLEAAVRGFRRRPVNTAIKLMALALGFACFLTANIIADYVKRADSQWANAGRIYAISQTTTAPGSDRETASSIGAISAPAVDFLRVDFPDLAIAATQTSAMPVLAGDVRVDGNILAVDPQFVELFDLPMRSGTAESVRVAGSALIDAAMAEQLFGTADVVGRSVRLRDLDVSISGVFSIPAPSHLGDGATGKNIRLILSRDTLADVFAFVMPDGTRQRMNFAGTNWASTCCTTYVMAPDGGSISPAQFQARLDSFSESRVPPAFGAVRYSVTPLNDIGQSYMNLGLFGGTLDLSLVTILNMFAMLILAVACLDFANLATAEASTRAKEIGLRKTVGASRAQVAAQAMVEAGLLTAVALAVVLPLTILVVTPLGRSIRLDVDALQVLSQPRSWLSVLGVAAVACLAAGAYPALVLARIRPVLSMRMTGLRGGAGTVRGALIVAQFAAASFLLAAVSVMLIQKAELRGWLADPDADPRLTIALGASTLDTSPEETRSLLQAFRNELLANPAITGLTIANNEPFRRAVITGGRPPGIGLTDDPAATRLPVQMRLVAHDYFTVAGIPLTAGQDFVEGTDSGVAAPGITMAADGDLAADPDAPPGAAIVDERTATLLGLTPQEAIGAVFYSFSEVNGARAPPGGGEMIPYTTVVPVPMRIVGVAGGRPLEYMAEGPANYVYMLQSYPAGNIVARLARDDVAGALAHIDATWRQFFPDRPIQRTFLDEAFDTNFAMFNMLGVVFLTLALIAIAIAAMGLFGIANFVVQRRLREIGVRKTLGADRARVMALFLWDFSKPVILANLIAWPVIYLAARAYLNLFVTRAELTPLPFFVAFAVSLLIAWLSVGGQAWKAARVKPAMVLKTE